MAEAAAPLADHPSSAGAHVADNENPSTLWAGSWAEQFPLRAKGRNLVNTRGHRYKLCGINWYGASDALHVVGGLRDRPLADICAAVSAHCLLLLLLLAAWTLSDNLFLPDTVHNAELLTRFELSLRIPFPMFGNVTPGFEILI
jgi:hypothetical protein